MKDIAWNNYLIRGIFGSAFLNRAIIVKALLKMKGMSMGPLIFWVLGGWSTRLVFFLFQGEKPWSLRSTESAAKFLVYCPDADGNSVSPWLVRVTIKMRRNNYCPCLREIFHYTRDFNQQIIRFQLSTHSHRCTIKDFW